MMDNELLLRLVIALETLAACVDPERKCLRMNDVDRAKVYSEHLGKKLSEPT